MDIPAIFIVHWPGEDVPTCLEHGAKLVNLAKAMGFEVTASAATHDELCSNCQNIAERSAGVASGQEGE